MLPLREEEDGEEEEFKGSRLWVNCGREERCMVDLAGVVDVAGMRDMHG